MGVRGVAVVLAVDAEVPAAGAALLAAGAALRAAGPAAAVRVVRVGLLAAVAAAPSQAALPGRKRSCGSASRATRFVLVLVRVFAVGIVLARVAYFR